MNKVEGTNEVSVILVNYNDKVHLRECLASLDESVRLFALKIIVVDNNSSDGSREFIKNDFPRVRLIGNAENMGFAVANNQGIKQSQGDFILFLNTDTVPPAEALSLLLQEMRANPELGAIGPALFKGKNNYQVSFGKKVNFRAEIIQKGFFNHYFRLRLKKAGKKREVGWLSAACLLARRKALEEANFFDENFFLYFEDIDLCYRIRKNGWKLRHLPQAKVFHKGGATTSSLAITSRYEYRRSQLYFYRKHNSRTSFFLLRFYLFFNFSLRFLFSFLAKDEEGRSSKEFFRLLKNQKSENRE